MGLADDITYGIDIQHLHHNPNVKWEEVDSEVLGSLGLSEFPEELTYGC